MSGESDLEKGRICCHRPAKDRKGKMIWGQGFVRSGDVVVAAEGMRKFCTVVWNLQATTMNGQDATTIFWLLGHFQHLKTAVLSNLGTLPPESSQRLKNLKK